jgi:hypothetical protein
MQKIVSMLLIPLVLLAAIAAGTGSVSAAATADLLQVETAAHACGDCPIGGETMDMGACHTLCAAQPAQMLAPVTVVQAQAPFAVPRHLMWRSRHPGPEPHPPR